MKKAVFFDWDGTLSADGLHVSPENRNAIRRLQEKSHLAFLCTGRAYSFIPEEALKFGFDGIVCGAGCHIIIGDKTIFHTFIPEPVVREVFLHFLKKPEGYCWLEGEDSMFLIRTEPSSDSRWPRLEKPEDFDRFVTGHPITKLTLGETLEEDSKALLAQHFSLISQIGYHEAVLKGHNKATGIEKALNYFHLTQENSVGVGDSRNDLDMLRYTALGIVMGTAPEEVKKEADRITGSAEENGVAQALERWVL